MCRGLCDTGVGLTGGVRAFLAVPIGPPARRPTEDVIARLRSRVDGVRWVDPATLHLTLHFFAALPASEVETIISLIRPVAQATQPFPIGLGGVGAFPPRGRPRVLWLGLRPLSTELRRLTLQVHDTLGRHGWPVEPRPLRAHVTLGRPGPDFDGASWHRNLADSPSIPNFTATEIILYESAGGHLARARFPLGGMIA